MNLRLDPEQRQLLAALRRRLGGGRWVGILLLVPAVIAAAMLASLFFALFLALFIVAGVVAALRLWWLRRKLRRATGTQTVDGEYVVIEKRVTVIEPSAEHRVDHEKDNDSR